MWERLIDPLVSFITFGYSQKGKKDRALFDLLMEQLPPSCAAVRLLKEQDMGAPFKFAIMTPLNHAREDWHQIDRKFLNKKIENRKNNFLSKLEEFLHKFSERSAGMGNGFISIGIRDLEDRPEMIKYHQELNQLGTESYELYCEFVDYARRKLPV